VAVNEPANFAVTIDNAPSSAAVGDQITVDYTVENTGGAQATQDITFDVNGTQEDANTGVTLGAGQTLSDNFTYSTSVGDVPQVTTTVASANDTASVTVDVQAPGEPEVGPDADLRIGGAAVTSILTGEDGDVLVDVTNVGQAAASFELALEFQTPDGTTVGGFDTVNTSELGPNAQETVSFSGVTGDLTVVGFYDIVVSATQSGEQFNDTDAFSVAVDVDNNGQPAANAANGPARFDGMFDSVSGQSNDRLGIVDVVALFANFDRDVVDDNAEFFRFNDPDDPDPTRVGIADVVALFQEV
jgi:hypothetical protein